MMFIVGTIHTARYEIKVRKLFLQRISERSFKKISMKNQAEENNKTL